jgi:hypothetical protein
MMTLLEAMDHPNLFAPWFKNPKHWTAWRSFIAALFALPLNAAQLAIFKECTQRTIAPTVPVKEAWMVIGRRGGKSFALALIATYLACFFDYRQFLAPGERGTVMVIAADRRQARTILRYVRGLLHGVKMLKAMIQRETAEAFDLTNFVTIEVAAASSKRTRGYTLVAALCDEIAFWATDDDAADPDLSILEALRPAMATIPNAMLLCASSPYAKRGALWDAFSRHFGKDTDVLVWRAPTRVMNPSVSEAFIDKAFTDDPASAAAEYGAEFRTDIAAFVSRDVVAAATVPGRFELPPMDGIHYVGFADASGGSGQDSFTASVAHIDRITKLTVIDAVREIQPPFSPEAAIGEITQLFKRYHVRKIVADRWGGEFPPERFRKFGIQCDVSEKTKSDIYRDFLPLLNSGMVELLDNPRLIKQLLGLERRTARGGRDSIDHAPGGHDDVINAAAGAAVLAGTAKPPMIISAEAIALSKMPPLNFGAKPRCFF